MPIAVPIFSMLPFISSSNPSILLSAPIPAMMPIIAATVSAMAIRPDITVPSPSLPNTPEISDSPPTNPSTLSVKDSIRSVSISFTFVSEYANTPMAAAMPPSIASMPSPPFTSILPAALVNSANAAIMPTNPSIPLIIVSDGTVPIRNAIAANIPTAAAIAISPAILTVVPSPVLFTSFTNSSSAAMIAAIPSTPPM